MLGRTPLLAAMALLAACAGKSPVDCPPQDEELAALSGLLKFNPEELAAKEAALPKPGFYGVYGYAVSTPGVKAEAMTCLHQKAYIKRMPGTSDVLCSDEIVNLQPAAIHFAERYNSRLARDMKLKCP